MAWIKVAQTSEVTTGRGTTVHVDGRELALFCIGNEFFCIDNVCPHMDGPLAEGDVRDDLVYCPWHYWPVNIRTGEVPYDPSICAATFPCRAEAGFLYIDFDVARESTP
jgi:nitrite reductase/ring-hydroxylating ferredoxin subunit